MSLKTYGMQKTILLLSFFISVCVFSQDVQWASKVIDFSSEFYYKSAPGQYEAKQILGEPSRFPNSGSSQCAWASKDPNNLNGEWIKVGYTKPQQVSKIYIAENYNAGATYQVFLTDTNNKSHLVYTNKNVKAKGAKGDMLIININQTPYLVNAVKVTLKTGVVKGHNQIDAIGISNDENEYTVKINTNPHLDTLNLKPENLGLNVNSTSDELCPVISPDGKTIYFTRQKHPENIVPKNQDIWFSKIVDGKFSPAYHFGEPLNNKSNNSVTSVTPDGQTLLLLNIYNKNGTSSSGLSTSTKTKDGWSFPEPVKIDSFYNNNKYGEYFLSNSRNIIIMAVQRNKGIGGKDLHISFKKDDNTWTVPTSLGEAVNTAANETSPFLASDNKTLYYATSGFPGYGSTDIFMTKRLDDTWTNWSKPINLGSQLNTSGFDAYYTLPASGKEVFFVSKNEENGSMDIYRSDLPEVLRPEAISLVKGRVLNAKDSTPISTTVLYHNLTDEKLVGEAQSAPKDGTYQITLPSGKLYGFSASKKGFIPVSENLDLTNITEYQIIERDLYLTPIEKNATITLQNIYFETNSYELKKESFIELKNLIKILQDNPTVKIQIEGHTDNVGSDSYNLKLSEKRANAVKTYLTQNGLKNNRVKAVGYGEEKPVVANDTDENRQKNRRVVFKVVSL